MLKKPLVIDIYNEPSRSEYDNSGKYPSTVKYQEYTFFTIDTITDLNYKDGIDRCAIIVSGKIYICRKSYKQIQDIILKLI